jgi:hypothetical protein
VDHHALYRVDGEVGRFEFETFDVRDTNGRIVFHGFDALPIRTGKQWHQTAGFKETAIVRGVLDRSYRKTAVAFNIQRRQVKGGTPLNTLRDAAEAQGVAIMAAMEDETKCTFAEQHVTIEGQTVVGLELPAHDTPPKSLPTFNTDKVEVAWLETCREMNHRGFTQEQIEKAAVHLSKRSVHAYESPEHTTNISVDDVCIKKQKPHRKPTAESIEMDQDDELKRVHTTVARIEHQGKGFTLVGPNLFTILRFILAFLLRNGLSQHRLRFYVDGQRTLQDGILAFFSWHRSVSLILDWFHLVKKFKELLSMAMKGKVFRNEQVTAVLRLLWYGLVDDAIAHLRSINPEEIKAPDQIEALVGYLERNRSWIPNYAMRRRLKLRNSSNPAERTNNLIASQRQKKNGMSWSPDGSQALSALACVVLNNRVKEWLTECQFSMTFNNAA